MVCHAAILIQIPTCKCEPCNLLLLGYTLLLRTYGRVNPHSWLGGLIPTQNIRKLHSRLHLVISNHGCGGVILLIHSWSCGVDHGDLISMISYLAETKICYIVSISVVNSEVFKPKHLLDFLVGGIWRLFCLVWLYLLLLNICCKHSLFFCLPFLPLGSHNHLLCFFG